MILLCLRIFLFYSFSSTAAATTSSLFLLRFIPGKYVDTTFFTYCCFSFSSMYFQNRDESLFLWGFVTLCLCLFQGKKYQQPIIRRLDPHFSLMHSDGWNSRFHPLIRFNEFAIREHVFIHTYYMLSVGCSK